ncbi:MAG: PrsW family glutamic-type intramembrane protease, partial [Thermoanaerobaculia bacterium]
MIFARTTFAFVPVCLFLARLLYIDSYKLVNVRRLVRVIAAGGVAAVVSYYVNHLARAMGTDQGMLRHVAAPAIEEALKLLPLIYLLRSRRIGFVIDAAILGFAAGTGFALVENLYYMTMLPDRSLAFWIVRGFGTAVMHGGTTALAAMITKVIFQRHELQAWPAILPGF